MFNSDDVDLIAWNSPTTSSGPSKNCFKLSQPLLPTINVQIPITNTNPFDTVFDKAENEIQNPFDEICSLVQSKAQKSDKENDSNLLNMTIFQSEEDDSKSNDSEILDVSKLDDELLDKDDDDVNNDDNEEDVMKFLDSKIDLSTCDKKDQKQYDMNNVHTLEHVKFLNNVKNKFLSQSLCDDDDDDKSKPFTIESKILNNSINVIVPNKSVPLQQHHDQTFNDSLEEDPYFQELCHKLECSFNKSSTIYEKIKDNEDKIVASVKKRRSVDFTFSSPSPLTSTPSTVSRSNEHLQHKHVQQKIMATSHSITMTPSHSITSKVQLKALESPNMRLKSNKHSKSGSSINLRQGPMKAFVPLQSMVKLTNNNTVSGGVLRDLSKNENDNSRDNNNKSAIFKSSYHRSPIKKLVLKSKSANSVPPLASSTPEKCIQSFSSPSPLRSSSGKPRSNSLSRLKQPKFSIKNKFNFLDDKENISLN